LLLFPQVWHNYRPDMQTGWSEFWVLFDGEVPGRWAGSGWLDADKPILHPGVHSDLVELFDQLLATARANPLYVNQVLAGLVIQLLASVLRYAQEIQSYPSVETAVLVRQAQKLIEEQWDQPLDFRKLAQSLGMNYRTFRYVFCRFAGVPPLQYLLNLRVNRAKPLLEKKMRIEEVAARTGFTDPYYFSRLFKQKTGLNPSKWRI